MVAISRTKDHNVEPLHDGRISLSGLMGCKDASSDLILCWSELKLRAQHDDYAPTGCAGLATLRNVMLQVLLLLSGSKSLNACHKTFTINSEWYRKSDLKVLLATIDERPCLSKCLPQEAD
jgi:hypothetical protein